MSVHELKIEPAMRLQVLDEEGRVDGALLPALGPEELRTLYRWMVLARRADERQLQLQRQGRIINFALSYGQEAAHCGSAYALSAGDWLVCGYRDLGARLVRGEPLADSYLHYRGYEEGNGPPPSAPRILPVSAFIGANILLAVGLGQAMRYLEEPAAALVYFGDGATSEGDFHEGLNLAAVWNSPVVFFCQNNQWAISTPLHRQTRQTSIARKAAAYGMPGIQVDGNDALGVYLATRQALERAHSGGGPTLIEALTYRLGPHASVDDPSKYRQEEDVAPWRKREPLVRFRTFLESQGFWDAGQEAGLCESVARTIEAAIAKAESHPVGPTDAPFRHLRETPHPELERQRLEFLSEVEAQRAEEEALPWLY